MQEQSQTEHLNQAAFEADLQVMFNVLVGVARRFPLLAAACMQETTILRLLSSPLDVVREETLSYLEDAAAVHGDLAYLLDLGRAEPLLNELAHIALGSAKESSNAASNVLLKLLQRRSELCSCL
jgi:hypothetical protein